MLELRRLDGTLLASFAEVPEGTLVHREIMGEHYLKLPFVTAKPFYLRIGDYVNTDFGKFELTKPYKPRYNTRTSGYDYDLQLDAYYMKWKNKKVRYMPEYGAKEVTFKLTANIETHLNVVLRSINALGAKDSNFRYNGQPYVVQFLNFPEGKRATAKYYLYDKTDIISALDGLAKLYECEWWVEDNIIYFGKCEIGSDLVDFDIDVSVDEMSRSESDTEYATRIYAFGSTRNLPHNYEDRGGDVTIDGVVEKRLTLPASLCPNGYLQDVQVRNETEAIEGVLVNEDIYPKVVCTVGEVTTYESEVEEDDGTTTKQTFYRIKDSSGFQFSEDMILEGESLHILFQSGSMNGMDFECQYIKDEKMFEVVVNEDYGRMLPDGNLHPVVGMKFVLYNWDSTKIESTGIIDAAKRELFDYTFEYLKESKIDPSTYDCTMKSVWVYNDGLHFRTFDIGTRVNLVNDAFFEESRTSRIIGFEIKLDKPYDTPKYTVGEKAAYSRRKDMERQIEAVTVNGNAYSVVSGSGFGGEGGGGGTSIYVIKRYDGAIPSDYNVFSAKRAMDEFVSRKHDDTALGHITFKKGLTSEMLAKLIGGAYFGTFIEGLKGGKIDENGDAELNSLIVRLKAVINELKVQGRSEFGDSLMSDDFTSGFIGGKGWAIMKERVQNALGVPENKYTGEFDNLVVRGALRIFTLVVSQLLGENDNRIFTAMLEVDHYDPNTGRVWLDTKNGKLYNPFRVGDYIMVQQYNGMPDSSNDYYVTKHYECVITGAGVGDMSDGEKRLDWVTIKNFISADGKLPNDCIKKGDTFCRVDNETDADRKGIIQIITVGSQTPYMDVHYGLKTNPESAHKGRIGNLKGINHYLFGQLEDFGAYLINLYAVGDFRVKRTGESVDAQIEMLKNQFATQFQQTTYEMTEEDNFLTNATFTQDMDGWTTQTEKTTMLSIDGTPLVINGATSIYGLSFARIENYEGKRMLRLRKTQIEQANSLIRKPGTHKEYNNPSAETSDAYKEVRDTLYLSIRYYVVSEGKMTLGLKQSAADIAGESAEERAKFMPFMNQQVKQVTGKWVTEQFEGTWNGKGTFVLSFTGEVYVSMLSLTDTPLDEFKRTVSTQIIQTATNIKLLGTNISKNGAAITQLGLDIDAAEQRIKLYADKKVEDAVTSLGLEIDAVDEKVTLYANRLTTDYYTSSQIDVKIDNINLSVSQLDSDYQKKINDINGEIAAAKTAIDNLSDATDELEDYVNGAFYDGIIENAEKVGIEKYLNDLATAYNLMNATYSKIYDNEYLKKDTTGTNTARANLLAAKTNLDTYYNALRNTINSVIADGKVTTSEKSSVNSAFSNYNSSVTTINQRFEEAQKAIEDWMKNYVDSENQKLKKEAERLAEEAAMGEYYEQSANPWSSWPSGKEMLHIGAKWKVTDGSGVRTYRYYDESGNLQSGTVQTGKIYRYIGSSTNQNVWEPIDEAAAAVSFISIKKDHISSVVANFDENGNVKESSGIATTAYGNRIWASKSGVDALGNRVSKAEAQILVQAGQISSKVEQDGIISAINQSAETVQIQASRIKLEGYTTINNSFRVEVDGTTHMGAFTVGSNGLYNGDYSVWGTSRKANFCYLNRSSLLLEQQFGYFQAGDIAFMKIGLGCGSDPDNQSSSDAYCASAMYIYRNMLSYDISDAYMPAAKIISDNAINRDIALRLEGGLQVWGGIIEKGYMLHYTGTSPYKTNVLDLSFGTTYVLSTTKDDKPQFFLPCLTEIRNQLGIKSTSESFAVPVKVIARKGTNNFRICSQKKALKPKTEAEGGSFIHNNGTEWENSDLEMGAGDVVEFVLCYSTSTGYYMQMINFRN